MDIAEINTRSNEIEAILIGALGKEHDEKMAAFERATPLLHELLKDLKSVSDFDGLYLMYRLKAISVLTISQTEIFRDLFSSTF